MSGEQLVDVRYRGLPLGTSLTLRDFGPETAYLEVDQPMPVGSVVDVTNDDGQTFSARVVHVREKTDSAPQSGMRIAVADAGDAARSWWAERVTQADPPRVKAPAAPAPEPESVPEAVPEAIPTEVTDDAKRTQVMSAIDLSQIEAMAGPEVMEEFRKREQEAAAVGVTETAPPEPDDDDDKKKKKRGRRRKKR